MVTVLNEIHRNSYFDMHKNTLLIRIDLFLPFLERINKLTLNY